MIVHVKQYRKQENIDLLMSYVSQPVATNYLHIPGKTNLESAYETFVNKALVRVCPRSVSPSEELIKDEANGYTLALEGVSCRDHKGISAPLPPMNPDMQYIMPLEDCGAFALNVKGWKQFEHDPLTGSCVVYQEDCPEDKMFTGEANVYLPLKVAPMV